MPKNKNHLRKENRQARRLRSRRATRDQKRLERMLLDSSVATDRSSYRLNNSNSTAASILKTVTCDPSNSVNAKGELALLDKAIDSKMEAMGLNMQAKIEKDEGLALENDWHRKYVADTKSVCTHRNGFFNWNQCVSIRSSCQYNVSLLLNSNATTSLNDAEIANGVSEVLDGFGLDLDTGIDAATVGIGLSGFAVMLALIYACAKVFCKRAKGVDHQEGANYQSMEATTSPAFGSQ